MKQSLFLVLLLVLLLPAACFYYTLQSVPETKPMALYKYETPMPETYGIEINSANITKLDGELADLIRKEAPLSHVEYPVISFRKKTYIIAYMGDARMSEDLRKTLDAHIQKRLPEFAREQAGAR